MVKRFLSYYKPYIGLFIIDILAAVAIAGCNLFYPSVVKDIINKYVHEQTPKMLIIFSTLLLVIYIIKAICTYIVSYHGHVMGIKMQRDMRRDLFKKYQSLPVKFYDNNKTGELLSRLVNDLFEVSELAHHGPENLILATLMFIGSFIILIQINLYLTLIVIAIIPFIILFTGLSRKEMRSAMKGYRKQTAVINATLENSLSGIRETKVYKKEEYEIERFSKANGLLASLRGGAMRSLGKYETIMSLISDLLYRVVIFAGGLFFFHGEIDAGEFAAFILYISMFLTPIGKIAFLFEQFQEGMTGFTRFTEIMDTENEEDTGTVELADINGEVEFKNVCFSYSENAKRKIINDLSLTVKKGETLALVGPSGGGKTTLCNLIPRMYNVDSGYIALDGININDIKLASLRGHIGVVSQNVFLFDGTIKENIAYGKDNATDEEIIEAAKKANIHDFITTLANGYDSEVGERGIKLSGGQRQRIAIARVFLKNPSLLILDEATSALDNVTELQIQASLEELSRGRTVIVVAHRLSTVRGADRIVVLDSTGIVESGTHDELMKNEGVYHRLYTSSVKADTSTFA